mmetsp:Transcript_39126/g.122374  ORF Transcript_39126/g.122374 Transcript_39126/m.122374 type:complete len:275 (+) Transcript_39126:169-993(+)
MAELPPCAKVVPKMASSSARGSSGRRTSPRILSPPTTSMASRHCSASRSRSSRSLAAQYTPRMRSVMPKVRSDMVARRPRMRARRRKSCSAARSSAERLWLGAAAPASGSILPQTRRHADATPAMRSLRNSPPSSARSPTRSQSTASSRQARGPTLADREGMIAAASFSTPDRRGLSTAGSGFRKRASMTGQIWASTGSSSRRLSRMIFTAAMMVSAAFRCTSRSGMLTYIAARLSTSSAMRCAGDGVRSASSRASCSAGVSSASSAASSSFFL